MRLGCIDRFEEGLAVVDVSGKEVHMPRGQLSAQAREGDVVDLDTGQVVPEESERLRQEVARARSEAQQGMPPSGGDFDL